jgi:hypothetical protein
MREIERIARLLEETFEGKPYYGPSVLGALENVTADIATLRPRWSAHGIWVQERPVLEQVDNRCGQHVGHLKGYGRGS